jgi:hypothetical protein
MTTEIETVTVDFEEFKASLPSFMAIKAPHRVSVIRGGEEVAVLGPWLPGEDLIMTKEWQEFFRDLFPPDPVDHENGWGHALEEVRGYRPFT